MEVMPEAEARWTKHVAAMYNMMLNSFRGACVLRETHARSTASRKTAWRREIAEVPMDVQRSSGSITLRVRSLLISATKSHKIVTTNQLHFLL